MLVQDPVGGPVDPNEARQWRDDLGLTHPVLADEDGSFLENHGQGETFAFYVVDRDGRVTWRALREGADTLEQVEAEVAAVMD